MRFSRSFWLLLLVPAVGCGGRSGGKTVPVTGKVTLDGRPLANAAVIFTPADPREQGKPPRVFSGRTDDQGNFSLRPDAGGQGAAPGRYRVSVSLFDRGGAGRPGRGQLLRAEYNHNTTLQFQVPPEGSKVANFDLSSNPRALSLRRPGGR